MKFKLKMIEKPIYLLTFVDPNEMSETFMRFQEHHESPEFRGKIFSRKEFKTWYCTTTPDGKYSYNQDWAGFNIPSYILDPFYDGGFKRLSSRETKILNIFRKIPSPFYIIGALKGDDGGLAHELAHGRFYTNEKYRKAMIKVLDNSDVRALKKYIKDMGYHDSSLVDEAHAYLLTDNGWLATKGFKMEKVNLIIKKLQAVERKFYPRTIL